MRVPAPRASGASTASAAAAPRAAVSAAARRRGPAPASGRLLLGVAHDVFLRHVQQAHAAIGEEAHRAAQRHDDAARLHPFLHPLDSGVAQQPGVASAVRQNEHLEPGQLD